MSDQNYSVALEPLGEGVWERFVGRARVRVQPTPIVTRREYALPNFDNTRIYLACRLWVAMLRLGVA